MEEEEGVAPKTDRSTFTKFIPMVSLGRVEGETEGLIVELEGLLVETELVFCSCSCRCGQSSNGSILHPSISLVSFTLI